MKVKNEERYQLQARILKALSHPARLKMVEELSRGEKCVCELTEIIGCDISTVSKHLAILRSTGLVETEKRGLSVYYRLCCPCIPQLLACVERTLKENIRNQLRIVKGIEK